jgi:hypothetical protein
VAGAETAAAGFASGVPYYFDSFDPAGKPWDPGIKLNLEEVFKNYQYYEIVFDKASSSITVKRYVRGNNVEEMKYLLQYDYTLIEQQSR